MIVSATKLKTFQTCARQFRYKYIDKVPSDKNQSLITGLSAHKAVERIYKDRSLEDARTQVFLTCYNDQLVEHEMVPDTRYIKDGVKMIDLYDFNKRAPVDPERDIEYEFMLKFPNVAHPICWINGYFDQIYDEGFVDLKSNKFRPKQFVLDNDLQFIIYGWAFNELMGYDPELRVWNHLRTGEDLSADTLGKEDLAAREIEKILEAQVTGIYDKHPGEWCGWCSYQEPCLGRKYT